MKQFNYKDKCDKCHKFNKCKGYNGSILCDECRKVVTLTKNNNICKIICDENNQQRFDFTEVLNESSNIIR